MLRVVRVTLLAVLSLSAFGIPDHSATAARIEQNGILLDAEANGAELIVNWRLQRPLSERLKDITAEINGRPISPTSVKRYPADGEQTAIVILFDATDSKRNVQIERFKQDALYMLTKKRDHHRIALGFFASRGAILEPASGSSDEFVAMVAAIKAFDQPAHLLGALQGAVDALDQTSATRRAVFVFTDGHSEDAGNIREELERKAKEKRVSLTFLVRPTERSAATKQIRELADNTGGQVIEVAQYNRFLETPFEALESGGTVRFSLDHATRFIWERQDADVIVTYGGKTIRVPVQAKIPLASIGEHIANQPMISGLAALGLVGLPFGLGLWLGGRKVRPTTPSSQLAVFGVLKNTETGEIFAMQKPAIKMGRAKDNDLIIPDASASRYHAILERVASSEVIISNVATNNVLIVNGEQVQTKKLVDGDIIEVGTMFFKYSQIA